MRPRPSAGVVSMTVLAGTATVGAGVAVDTAGSATTGASRVVAVEAGTVQSTVTARGALAAATDTAVDFKTTGRIERVYVSEGDHVTKGQLLARLDDTAQRAALVAAKAALAAAGSSAAGGGAAAGGAGATTGGGAATTGGGGAAGSGGRPTTGGGGATQTPTPSPTRVPTPAGTPTATASPTPDPTATPSPTASATPTPTPSATATPSPSATATPSPTPSAAPTPSTTPSPSSTATPSPTATGTPSPAASAMPKASATPSATAEPAQTGAGSAPAGGSGAAPAGASGSSGGGGDTAALSQAVTTARAALRATRLRAPVSGTIAQVNGRVGQSASDVTSSFTTIINPRRYTVGVSVGEADVTAIHAGQRATVTVDAVSGLKLAGHVTAVGLLPDSSASSSAVTYPVTITLDAPTRRARAGMTTAVRIVTARALGLSVPTQALDGPVLTLVRNGDRTTVRVTPGLAGDTRTLVTDGVTAGDQVLETSASAQAGARAAADPGTTSSSTTASPFGANAARAGGPPAGGGFPGGGRP